MIRPLPDLLTHFDGDEAIALTAARAFKEHSPAMIAKLRSAVDCQDLSAISDIAHSLKGAVSHFPAPDLYEAIAEIERIAERGDTSPLRSAMERIDGEIAYFNESIRSFLAGHQLDHRR